MSRPWEISHHAALRIIGMCIPPAAVRECMDNPQLVRGILYQGKVNELFMRGEIGMVFDPRRKRIVTAIWKDGDPSDRRNISKVYEGGGWIDY
jgi:hypothetical protein